MKLDDFFREHNRIALALSGGVDSSYLLYKGLACGAEIKAYFVKSAFQPQFELDDALRTARELGADLKVLSLNILDEDKIKRNPPDRCYHCKKKIFSALAEEAQKDGFWEIMDGTNASDDAEDRPGMKALGEMKVLSPLRLCGITKEEVRAESQKAGLFTWDKPSYACLATRVPAGVPLEYELLERIEKSEKALSEMGYKDFRVRVFDGAARIQLRPEQLVKAAMEADEINDALSGCFDGVFLDLAGRK